MQIINDNNCGWIQDLNPRNNVITLNKNYECDWLIVGAGYTGLSAARKLAELHTSQKIIITDAQLAGEGASGRNSGYLVDTTLNDGFTSNKELNNYKIKTNIYNLGIDVVKKFIREYQVDCDWNECGKYFASSNTEDLKTLSGFSDLLKNLNFEHEILFKDVLSKRLGTQFYKVALKTKGGILLHPAKLARAMVKALPSNIELFENSTLLDWSEEKDSILANFSSGSVRSKKVIFATNGFLKSLGIKTNYNFPITLTASMTRRLSEEEFKLIGEPKEWGVLPVRPMGATVRMTKDRRILIRNTAEIHNPFKMSKIELSKRAKIQKFGLKKRFPELPDNIIKSTWSGIVSRTRNSSQIFEKISDNVFVAGCYNGSGIGVGTLFGEQIALFANGEITNEIKIIDSRSKPTILPPSPLLDIGVKFKLIYERLRAVLEN